MIRATTPTHYFKFDVNASEFDSILITYKQCGTNVLNLTEDDLTLNENTASITLTETQTKSFVAGSPVYIQVRCALDGEVMASEIARVEIKDVLNDSLIG